MNIGPLRHGVLFQSFEFAPSPQALQCGVWGCVGRVEKTTRERVPWESNSQTSTLCTLVCGFTSPLPSQRLSLALCRQKLKFTEKIVTVSSRAVAVCSRVPLPAPVHLMPLGGRRGGFAIPLCCCFPGGDSEAEEIVCSTWRKRWLEDRGVAPSVSGRCS